MRNLLSALGILFFGLFLAYLIGTSKPRPEKAADELPPPVSVNVVIAKPGQEAITLESHATLEARQHIDLIAEISGKVIDVSDIFYDGASFEKGQSLLTINPVQYEAALAQAKADMNKAKENLASERARAEQAKKEWKDLGNADANDLYLRKPQLASAEAAYDASLKKLEQARYDLEQTQAKPQFDGRIIETYVNKGQFVNKGEKIANIYSLEEFIVKIPLTQKQLEVLNISFPFGKNNQLPNLVLTSTIGKKAYTFEAEVINSSSSFDTRNQTAHIVARITSNAEHAVPGLYTKVRVTGNIQENVIRVPEDAFHDKRYLLVLDNNNAITFRKATFLARASETEVYLSSDLVEGDKIVTNRLPLAAPGMVVAPNIGNPESQAP